MQAEYYAVTYANNENNKQSTQLDFKPLQKQMCGLLKYSQFESYIHSVRVRNAPALVPF